MQHAVDI